MKPFSWLLLGGAAVGLYVILRPRFPGDRARIGDEVLVPPSALGNSAIVIPGLNDRTQFVIIKVASGDRDTLTGRPIGSQGIPTFPMNLPEVTVQRSAVSRVVRDGVVL